MTTLEGNALLALRLLIERQNLSIRMGTRRLTRLTNAYSKKRE